MKCVRFYLFSGLLALMAMVGAVTPSHASNHSKTVAELESLSGMTVPALAMNQMEAYAAVRGTVVVLGDRLLADDPRGIVIGRFVARQYAACYRMVLPGAVTDEANPLHPCTHGVLAGTAALLKRLKAVAGDDDGVRAVAAEVDRMLLTGGHLSLCAYSAAPVPMDRLVTPTLRDIGRHPPVQAVLSGVSLLLLAVLLGLLGRLRRRPRAAPMTAA